VNAWDADGQWPSNPKKAGHRQLTVPIMISLGFSADDANRAATANESVDSGSSLARNEEHSMPGTETAANADIDAHLTSAVQAELRGDQLPLTNWARARTHFRIDMLILNWEQLTKIILRGEITQTT